MGISAHLALMLLQEHQYKPITGRVLFIGRQTFSMSIDQASTLVEETVGYCHDVGALHIDTKTKASSSFSNEEDNNLITDESFFALFSDAQVTAVDVTDYEGAEIIHDMTQPLPDHMIGAYDFVINGSCLDNIFDPAAAQRNFGRCLKPNGRLFQVEFGSSFSSAYVMFSPDWFYDFYLYNNWHDAKVYVCRVGALQEGYGHAICPWDIYHWTPAQKIAGANTHQKTVSVAKKARWIQGTELVVSIAERGVHGTVERSPVQAIYRPREHFEEHLRTALRWLESDRPLVKGLVDKPEHPLKSDKYAEFYQYCGTVLPDTAAKAVAHS